METSWLTGLALLAEVTITNTDRILYSKYYNLLNIGCNEIDIDKFDNVRLNLGNIKETAF